MWLPLRRLGQKNRATNAPPPDRLPNLVIRWPCPALTTGHPRFAFGSGAANHASRSRDADRPARWASRRAPSRHLHAACDPAHIRLPVFPLASIKQHATGSTSRVDRLPTPETMSHPQSILAAQYPLRSPPLEDVFRPFADEFRAGPDAIHQPFESDSTSPFCLEKHLSLKTKSLHRRAEFYTASQPPYGPAHGCLQ